MIQSNRTTTSSRPGLLFWPGPKFIGNNSCGSHSIIHCYLVVGSDQEALDILDGEVASGRVLLWWWEDRMLPWWALVEDDPGYRELVGRINEMLEQQRALLQ